MLKLCAEAREAESVGVTIDAEEAERLDLMLDVFEASGRRRCAAGWDGLGLAVQGYQKRALPVIAWLADLARRQRPDHPRAPGEGRLLGQRDQARPGARAIADYPVFTRKAGTDVSYLACARALLADAAPDLSAIRHPQRPHAGRGRGLCRREPRTSSSSVCTAWARRCTSSTTTSTAARRAVATRIYAPVGSHEDLLSYLVRRLLENGANTSFVNRLANDEAPIEDIIADPVKQARGANPKRNPRIAKPEALFPGRRNSAGPDA